jgi:hypothetical protein
MISDLEVRRGQSKTLANSLFHDALGKLAWRINPYALHCFAVERSEMRLIAGHECIAFQRDCGCEKPAIILWQWGLEGLHEWRV